MASHFPLYNKIKEARDRGAKVLLIDPRKNSFAKFADMYFPIKPATDGALALGIINIIIEHKWYDQAFVKEHTKGFEEQPNTHGNLTRRYVAEETGINQMIFIRSAKLSLKALPGHL